jgi:hypothetical protein
MVYSKLMYWLQNCTNHRQGLPGDGRDGAGVHKRPQNDPWSMVNSARKKKPKPFYSLPTAKYCPHMPSSSRSIKPWENHSCCSEIPHLRHVK